MMLFNILMKFLAPLFVIFFTVRAVRRLLGGGLLDDRQDNTNQRRTGSPLDPVIEICPECGNVKEGRSHKCK